MDIIAILPRIEAFSTLQARMDPAVGSKRKLNPSSPGATVMLSIFVDVGHGSRVMLCCCDCFLFSAMSFGICQG